MASESFQLEYQQIRVFKKTDIHQIHIVPLKGTTMEEASKEAEQILANANNEAIPNLIGRAFSARLKRVIEEVNLDQ